MSNRKAADLAARIGLACKAAGMTKRALADETGIPYATLNRKLSTSPEKFTFQDVARIAAVLGVDFDILLATPATEKVA